MSDFPARKPKSEVPILPKQPSEPERVADSRRARKQNGSRTARERESLRKLNHSIIEKARRTKINDTLAALKQLIPPDFGYPQDAEEGDEEYADGVRSKGKKKKEEREFKLEILVRTVAYMRTLLDKVADLEAEAASADCQCNSPSSKRKFALDEDIQTAKRPKVQGGLPSIASWLPQIELSRTPPLNSSHLPSPPASAHFSPIMPVQIPPTLSLSPDEESAASLLLQMGTPRPGQSGLVAHTPSSMFEMGRK